MILTRYHNKTAFDKAKIDKDDDNSSNKSTCKPKTSSDESTSKPKTTCKAQCAFRLCNILFSDEFAEEFMHLGDRMTRDQLDRGKAHGEDFWVKVEQAFADETFEEASILKFQDNEHFQDLQVDMSVIIPHN